MVFKVMFSKVECVMFSKVECVMLFEKFDATMVDAYLSY
jgi:hypothetical protein